jgi:hypothetical protein
MPNEKGDCSGSKAKQHLANTGEKNAATRKKCDSGANGK